MKDDPFLARLMESPVFWLMASVVTFLFVFGAVGLMIHYIHR